MAVVRSSAMWSAIAALLESLSVMLDDRGYIGEHRD